MSGRRIIRGLNDVLAALRARRSRRKLHQGLKEWRALTLSFGVPHDETAREAFWNGVPDVVRDRCIVPAEPTPRVFKMVDAATGNDFLPSHSNEAA